MTLNFWGGIEGANRNRCTPKYVWWPGSISGWKKNKSRSWVSWVEPIPLTPLSGGWILPGHRTCPLTRTLILQLWRRNSTVWKTLSLQWGLLPKSSNLFEGNCFLWSLKMPPTCCPKPIVATAQAIKQDLIARAPTISMEDAGDFDKMTEDDLMILFVQEVGLLRKNNTK